MLSFHSNLGGFLRVLVIGSGGREHALAWRLAKSDSVTQVFATPGNPGIAQVAQILPTGSSPDVLAAAARSANIDLTVVGPEVPLVAGVVDTFRAEGLHIVGPTAAAARLEGSKVYSKQFFKTHNIPTARFLATQTRADALAALSSFRFPVVIKTDGLAAGKGVVIAQDRAEAETAIATLGDRLVIEEFLTGEEVSFIVLADGRNVVPLAPTQDHKAVFDDDAGPNTGGMGAYCDSGILSDAETRHVLDVVIHPTIEATGFTGFLYAGLMMTKDGPKVLEFNVRLGDPETQPLMHRLKTDLAPVLLAAATGHLDTTKLDWNPGPSVCVVLTSHGYPGAYETGQTITGIVDAEATGATVFHAGTRQVRDQIETSGGRVLGVTASGQDLPAAIRNAYHAVDKIHFDGMHYRRDIGRKGLTRYNKSTVPGT